MMNETPEHSPTPHIVDLFSLQGKTVVVTGAGSGLGRAIAEACAEAGGAVVCAGRSAATAETADSLRERGLEALDVLCDVSHEEEVATLMAAATRWFGRLDVLFCNAGTSDYYKRADQTSLEEWEEVIRVDLTGVFLCVKHAVPKMLAQQRGKIITTASVWGEIASDTVPVPAYAAAKAGVIGLTRELALEYIGTGITANAISPGFFETKIGHDKALDGDVIDRLVAGALRRTPIHRFMQPAELKGAAVFLASSASDALNGQTLTIDGGLTAA